MNFRKVLVVAAMIMGTLVGRQIKATTRSVGSGKPYPTIQAAVDESYGGDEIVVYEGTYDGFTLSGNDMDHLTIRAYKNPIDCTTVEERVTITSPIILTNWSEFNLIQGFYVTTDSGSGPLQDNYVARKNTWRNMVVYSSSGAASYSYSAWGWSQFEHCTIYDNGAVTSLNYMSQWTTFNTISAFNADGYNGQTLGNWNCVFDNPNPDPGYNGNAAGANDINVDPQFISTEPANPQFLWLMSSSPCIGAGSSGSTIGALGYVGYAERHVGDGYLYSTIQEAVNAADPEDHIVIHEGIYFESVTLDVVNDQYELTIEPYADDKVLIVGGINIQGDSAPVTYNESNLIKGLYIQPTSSTGCYSSYARNNTWQNVVVYGNEARVAFGGDNMNGGQDAIEHCSVQGCGSIGSYGTSSSAVVSDMVAAFNAGGWSSANGSPISYSDWYNNPSASGYDDTGANEDGTCISSDPLFVTTYSNSDYFLLLKTASSPCVGTGSGGSNRGALPDSTMDFGSPDTADDDPVGLDDPSWSFEYLGQDWASPDDGSPTETPVWNRYYSNGYSSLGYDWETTDWFLHQYCGDSERLWWYQTDPASGVDLPGARNWEVDFNVGATIEFRTRVYGSTTAKVYAGDGSKWFNIAIQGDPDDPNHYNKLTLDGAGEPVVYWIDTTEWHVYRLVIEAGKVGLYIDGALSPVAIITLQSSACNDQILFGDRETAASVYIDWDYVRVYLDGPLPVLPGELIGNTPVEGESFSRYANNQIEIVSSRSLVGLPSPPLSITMGASAIDVGGDFTYYFTTTTEPNDTLVAIENGTVLQDERWYRIEPTTPWIMSFAFDIPTQQGDVDSDQDVDVSDLASLQMAWSSNGGDLGNVDLDGDCDVDNWDYSVVADNWSDTVLPLDEFIPDVAFTEFAGNPLIDTGPEPGLLHITVRRKNAVSDYMCWYSTQYSTRTIALATSPDGVNWTKQGTVISRGATCHMPTVLWDPDAGTSGLWKMWYTYAGTSQYIAYATSPNGTTWTDYGMVLERSTDPDAVDYSSTREPTVIYDAEEGLYKMWYWANNTLIIVPGNYGAVGLAYAESPDGIHWTKYGELMEEWGFGSFPIGPEVLKIDGVYYLWYDQGDMHYAVSLDGIVWLAYDSNPVISRNTDWWNNWYIQAPTAVYDESAGKLYLYYNGAQSPGETCRIGGSWTWFEPR